MKTSIGNGHKPLLIVANNFPPGMGGLQEAVYNISKTLHSLNIKHEVVSTTIVNSLQSGRSVYGGVPVHRILFRFPRLNEKGLKNKLKAFSLLPIFPVLALFSFTRLFALCLRLKPVLINLHLPLECALYALPIANILQIPLVVNIHGMEIDGYHRYGFFRKLSVRTALRWARMVLSNSHQLLNKAHKIVPTIPDCSYAVGNGIDLDFFNEKIGCGKPVDPVFQGKYILALGRFVHKKGFDILIEAFSMLDSKDIDATLIIVGDGILREEYERRVRELALGERVVIWRRANRDEVPGLIAGSEMLVVPSREEPFGIVVLEGMASRVPIIAARTDGITEIIEDEITGLLYDKESPEALSQLILRLYHSEGLKGKLVEAGYKLVAEEFTWKRIVRKFIEKFDEALHAESTYPPAQ